MLPIQKVVCPTDFSDFSYEALDQAGELAAHFGAQMCVLHVVQPMQNVYPFAAFGGFVVSDETAYDEAVKKSAEEELKQLIERHSFANVRVRALVRSGYPAEEIVAAAQEENADLIVIATHGLSGWRQYFFGSVAEKVLRLAHCPVLVTRVEKPQEGA